MRPQKKDLLIMNAALLLSAFGGSLTWSGLPLYTAQFSGQLQHLSLLFICETAGGLLFTLLGGKLSDRFSRKSLAVASSIFSFLSLVVVFITHRHTDVWPFYLSGLFNSIMTALSSVALSLWYNDVSAEFNSELEIVLGKKNALMILAKALGFTLGPALYLGVKKWGLLIDAGLSLAEGAFLLAVFCPLKKAQVTPQSVFSRPWKHSFRQKKLKHLALLHVFNGVLSFPLLQLTLMSLTQQAPPKFMLSMFWAMASLGSFISNSFLARGFFHKKLSPALSFKMANAMLAAALLLLGFETRPWGIIALFMFFTLSNPVITNLSSAELFRTCKGGAQGEISGVCFSLSDAAGLGAVSIISLPALSPFLPYLFWALIPLILIRERLWPQILERK